MLILILMASLFITLALGFYVLVAAPHHAINRTFAVFIGLMILWIVKDIAFWGFHEVNKDGTWWAMVSFLIGIILQLVLLLFAEVFPENARPRWRRLAVLALPLLLLAPALLSGAMWERVGFRAGQFSIALKPAAYAYGVYNFALLAAGVNQLVSKYRRYRGTLWGKQLASVILAVVVTGVLTGVSTNLLPVFGIYRMLPICSLFIVVGSLIYAYAISNFKLFSLQTALDQLRLFPIAYKVTIAVAATGLIGFFLCQLPVAIWSFDAPAAGWKRFIIFSTISGLVPSLVLILLITKILSRPLRDLTETTLDVARGNYGAQTTLTSNDELGVLASSFNVMSRKMAEDIARLKEINQALIRTEKLATAGTLAAGVAHEVNNPLASISSLVQSLMARAQDERDQATLRLIFQQITRISSVLRNLMDFARPKAPARAPVDLNEIIARSLELARFDKSFKNLSVRAEFAPDLPLLLLDADQMQQVFLNLLLNARDATGEQPEQGEIAIRTYRHANEVYAEIADNGRGIQPEHLERIFDPFFTTKPKGQGTGLGLSVCHSIITAHGGRISVASQACGTSFTIVFPAEALAPALVVTHRLLPS